MRLAKGQPRLPAWIVGLFAFAGLVMYGCAANSAYGEVGPAPTMTTQVLTLYNEGAAAFRTGEFAKAKERYQAALDEARALGDDAGIGACLAGLGAVYQVLQDYPKALDSFSAALGYLTRTGNLRLQALAYGAIGEVYAQMGDNVKAVEAFNQGLSIAEKVLANASEQEKLTMLPFRGMALGEKAIAHEKLGQYVEAVEGYRRAAADFEVVGDKWKEGLALWSAGIILRTKMNLPREATGLLDKAWQLLQDAGKVVDAAWALSELAWAYLQSGEYEKTQAAASALVEVAGRERLPELVFQGYFLQGQASEGLFQYEQALRHYQAALENLRGGERKADPGQVAALLWVKGKLHRLLSQYGEAIEHFHLAAVRYRQIQGSKNEAETLADLAEVFFWVADHRAATKYYKQALDLYREMGDLRKQVKILALLAEASWLGEETSADVISRYLQEGRTLLNSVRDTLGFDPVTPLGEAQRKTEEKFLTKSQELLIELRQKIPSLSARDLYAAAYVTFLIKESKNTFEEWQIKVPSLGTDYLMAAGALHQKSGAMSLWKDPVLASGYFRLAHIYHTSIPYDRDLGFEWAKDWFYLGESYRRQREFDLALLYFYKARTMGVFLRSSEVHWVYAGLAQTYADIGDFVNAYYYYGRGLELLESVQRQQGAEELKIGVFEGALYFYRPYVTLLLDLYKKSENTEFLHKAFEVTERLRVRAFLEILGKSQATRLGGELGVLASNEEQIRHRMAQIHRQLRVPNLDKAEEARLLDRLEGLQQSWRSLQQEAAQQSPRYSETVFPRPVTVKDVQSFLTPDAVLLEYSVDSEASTLWAITHDQVQAYTLPGSERLPSLEQYLKRLREPLVGLDEISQHMNLGRDLYQALVGPAKQQVLGKKHLILVPDGPLYYLPFETLIVPHVQDGSNESQTLTEVPYLVKEFRVSYVPSASVLVAKSKGLGTGQSKPQYPLAAFGDPLYGEGSRDEDSEIQTGPVTDRDLRVTSLGRLEFSAEEVRRIAGIWGVPLDSAHINLGDRVTVERVRAMDLSRYRMLHFATHGVLGDQIRWTTQPALVLSQVGATGRHTGLLQFSDILDLKLNADLVVLSACETALGRLREGEGIVGLTRAFLYAGASSVVVSLWKVEDQSTSLLMERFYERLKRGESKAEALRQAKLELLQTTTELKATGMPQPLSSPFYWAPFILVGEGD